MSSPQPHAHPHLQSDSRVGSEGQAESLAEPGDPGEARRSRITVSPTAYRRITAVTLAALVMIMVTGAAVRLTGSGMGCSTWPSCEPGSFTPRSASDAAGMVEFGNRLVTGAVGLLTVAAVLGARWRRPRRDDLYRWSLGLPAWVFANALVGALVVWLHLSPASVIAHFLLSLGAVWNAVVLHHKAGEEPVADTVAGADAAAVAGAGGRTGRRALAAPSVQRACNYLLAVTGMALVSGTLVTGSGPHAGDEEADRLSLELGEVVRLHGASVILLLLLTLSVVWMARRGDASPPVERRLRELLVVLVAQGAVGYTQYFTGVPAALVAVHVLGAACVWIAVLRVRLSLTEPVASPAPEAPAWSGSDEAPVRAPDRPAPAAPAEPAATSGSSEPSDPSEPPAVPSPTS